MALVQSCFCCSLVIACGFFAVYLLIAYLIAFAFELLWVLKSTAAVPAAAVLLCAGYFSVALFAALLIHGIATKNTLCLICWMFAVTILTFPEAGMVIYMSVQHWRIETLYGMTELATWLVRIVVNVFELVLVQSLYTLWKEEDTIKKRLNDLNSMAMNIPRESLPLNSQFYQNNAYNNSLDEINLEQKRPSMPNNLSSLPYNGYQVFTTQSEFNASIFMPHPEMPLGTNKTQSLMDLRFIDHHQDPYSLLPKIASEVNTNAAMAKYASLDDLNDVNNSGHVIRNRSGFYAQPLMNYGVPIYYGPLDGPDFLIYKKQVDRLSSKNSLSNASADDVQKYRDVAL